MMVLRCRGGMRRQMSHAVSARPTGPARRVSVRVNQGTRGIVQVAANAEGSELIRQPITLESAVVRRSGPKTARRRAMPVHTPLLFAQVIQAHLDLQERNSDVDH